VSVSLGNAHWLVSTRLVACRKKDSSPQDLARYEDMIKSAIAGIGRGIKLADAQSFALDKGAAYYYREQAQLAFILTACQDQDTLYWYEQAIAFYDQAIAADPSNADYAALRGRIAYAVGLDYPERRADAYQKALTDLSLSLAMRPDNYETLRYRAAVAFDLAGLQPQTAEGLARRESYALISVNDRKRMIELDTSDAARTQDAKLLATSYLRLGFTNYLQGKYPAAIEALDQGLVHNANYSTLYFVKGLAELAAGNETNAQRSYSAGLDVVKKLPQPDRAPFLEDAIQDLDELGQQKPALKATTDNLAQTLRAAR
jgi:tetratricopeptide (TPR) repeat protein